MQPRRRSKARRDTCHYSSSHFLNSGRSSAHLQRLGVQNPLKKPRTTNLGPFGEVIRATGPIANANPFRFSTKYQDDETDLLYYGFRYYNASTGRWLSRDLIGEDGGNNLYGFVQQSPISKLDLLGLKKCGVESFSVKWRLMGYVDEMFLIEVRIKFKEGGDYDPRCCEYKQNVATKYKVTHADGSPPTIVDTQMHDDGYSRADGGGYDSATFSTTDHPGIANVARDSVIAYYSFTAEQIVYSPGKSYPGNPKKGTTPCDCEKNKQVAKKGPHTATAKGPAAGPIKWGGVPADL